LKTAIIAALSVFIAFAAVLTGAPPGVQDAEASHAPQWSLHGPGCSTFSGSLSCTPQPVGGTVVAMARLDEINLTPATFGAIYARISVSGPVEIIDRPGINEAVWQGTPCTGVQENGEWPSTYAFACFVNPGDSMTGTGPFIEVDVKCTGGGTGTITLVHGYPDDTFLIADSGSGNPAPVGDHSGSTESVSVSCVPCTPPWDFTVQCFTTSSLWHREGLASISGMPGGMLAFNQGCTGPTTEGCNYATGSQVVGDAASPALSPTGGTLTFKTARWTEVQLCGGYDRSSVLVSTDGGSSYAPLDLSSGTITSGGQWLAGSEAPGEVCGHSLTAQTVEVPLPAGATNVAFRFDSSDEVQNAHEGWFIDDVNVSPVCTGNNSDTGPAPPAANTGEIGNGRFGGLATVDDSVPNGDADVDACDTDDDNDGIADGSDPQPGGDVTYDDDNDGNPAMGCLGGTDTDAGEDGPSWDADCDGRRDGISGATCASLSASTDGDGDRVPERAEVCNWGTSDGDTDSDGDGLTDCLEIVDVNGDGMKAFLSDLIPYAKAVQLPGASFGKDGDFDYNGDDALGFLQDLLPVAKLIQLAPASGGCGT
jgi:hypothetical protein